MDIPAVVGAREASRLIRQDDCIIIDGDAGVVIVDPSPIVLEEYRFRQRQSELERSRLDRLRHTPAVTLDGQARRTARQHRDARRCPRGAWRRVPWAWACSAASSCS
jgi:phosphoenolpyruvate-protein kinase (PTS system EI component)